MKLPIPHFREHYLNSSQAFNFFCIEHYFDDGLLEEQNMIKSTLIPNVFEIRSAGKAKNKFSSHVRKLSSPEIFENFKFLFSEIDKISGVENIDYDY